MRGQGMTVRAIAAVLGVSHPTILRDLRATTRPRRSRCSPCWQANRSGRGNHRPGSIAQQRLEARRSKDYRWHYVAELRQRGASLRIHRAAGRRQPGDGAARPAAEPGLGE